MIRRRPAIVAAVVVNSNRVLLVRRRIPEGSLAWQFPAGEMEPGETPLDTAMREALEEVGLAVIPMVVIGERDHPLTGRFMVYVACAIAGVGAHPTLIDADELDRVEWCSWPELRSRIPGGLYLPVEQHLKDALEPS